jgi:hypothetical protein
MNKEQVAWVCGMAVGVIFGALIAMASGLWAWLAFIAWLIVLLGYIYEYGNRGVIMEPPPLSGVITWAELDKVYDYEPFDEEGDAHDYWPRPAANKWGDWVDEDQPVS